MQKHFITYGSYKFTSSAKQVIKEAKQLNTFSSFRRYSRKDLPQQILSSPLFFYKRGDGYWLWKPFVILDYLKVMPEGDFLVYSDSGSILKPSEKWESYFDLLKEKDLLLFQYKNDFNYGWEVAGPRYTSNTRIKIWAKKELLHHFGNYDIASIREKTKILAGLIFIKNSPESRKIISDWLETMLFFPELVIDPLLHEEPNQDDCFAFHRHDQSVLSIVARIYEQKNMVTIIDEEFEFEEEGQILMAARRVAEPPALKKIYRKIRWELLKR